MERYRRVFGPLEHNVTIGSVEFVLVDAQALDGDYHVLCSDHLLGLNASHLDCLDLIARHSFYDWVPCFCPVCLL